jgi:hypothetical protein
MESELVSQSRRLLPCAGSTTRARLRALRFGAAGQPSIAWRPRERCEICCATLARAQANDVLPVTEYIALLATAHVISRRD